MKICSIDGCAKNAIKRGWCNMHYLRWRKNGDPNCGGRRYSTPEESFLSRTKKTDNGCIEWTGSHTSPGYGIICVKRKMVPAHRCAWERVHGPIGPGLHIDHVCFNRSCVNVEHLRAVTQKQNNENPSGLDSRNKSGHRGVSWCKRRRKWIARVGHNGKGIHLGYFDDPEEAAAVAKKKRLELFTHNNLDRAL